MKQDSESMLLSPRGGKREGAGRPPTGVRKVQITLDDKTIEKGKKIGEGNLSRGVRIAVKEHRRKK
jgi:hypothetical protein